MFELFRRGAGKHSNAPVVTLRRGGTLALNKSAHDMINNTQLVDLMYDRDEGLLGLRPAPKATSNTYSLHPQSRKTGTPQMLISVQAFAKYYGISVEVSKRFRPFMKGDILCVNLAEEGGISD